MSKTKLSGSQRSVKAKAVESQVTLKTNQPHDAAKDTADREIEEVNRAGDMGRSFSSRLRGLRRDKELSLRKLGREIGVTANAVLRWEKDEVTPTRGKMLELARFFDVEPAWLAWGIGSRRARLNRMISYRNLPSATKPN